LRFNHPGFLPMRALLLALIVALTLLASGTLRAEEQSDDAFEAQVAGWQQTLDKAGSTLVRANLAEGDYDAVRQALGEVFEQARKASAASAATVSSTRPMLDALGKRPAEGAPAEAENVGEERERLEQSLTRYDGRMRQSDLIATRADILLRTANERRLNQFTETLFLRGASPLIDKTWQRVPAEAQFLYDRVKIALTAVSTAAAPSSDQLIQLALLAAAALVGGWLVQRLLARRFGQHRALAEPNPGQQAIAAAVETVAGLLVPGLLLAVALSGWLDFLTGLPKVTVLVMAGWALAAGLVGGVFTLTLGQALLAPRRPAWRLIAVADRSARHLGWRLRLAALTLGLAGTVIAFLETALVPPELHAVASSGAKLVGALGLLLLVLPPQGWRSPRAPRQGEVWGLRLLLALVTLVVLGLAAARYHNLSLYVAELALAGVLVIGVVLVLRSLLRGAVDHLAHGSSPRLAGLRRTVLHTEQDTTLFLMLTHGLIDLALIALGLLAMVPVSGIAWAEFTAWGSLFLRGFRIGEVTLSPGDIVTALALVLGIMALTRFLQRRVDERVLQRLPIDRGVRHSISTALGYVGALAALLAGVGTLGLSFANLALIAGALSVGIGFGLQAIVSNFVAGLILLVERPIKVGDWIVIGEHEGVVKRISVRATEIQTFQHASVIIPNSELISKAVKNWTYKDKFGRIDIPLVVDASADAEVVRGLLLACAAADARVVSQPRPNVVFKRFGDGTLELELRCFVSDIEGYIAATTDLRFAILKALRQNAIPLPVAERHLHSPALDRIAELLAERADKPAASL